MLFNETAVKRDGSDKKNVTRLTLEIKDSHLEESCTSKTRESTRLEVKDSWASLLTCRGQGLLSVLLALDFGDFTEPDNTNLTKYDSA